MPSLRNSDQDLLHKLLLGQLPSAEVERLSTEYADDGRLAELAESLAGKDDALLDLLHNHETAVADPEGERLVERLMERLKPAFPAKPRDDTAAMKLADASTEPSSPDLTAPPPELPERLEHYRPIKVLGQGGMGTVYLAEDTRLGREVAIKTLRPELAINPQAKERFLREARSAAKLEHDHIIPIYSVGEAADGTPFLAMPLLKGEPLDALIRRKSGPLPVALAVRLAREVASGLAAAHARGLIHRDIKPANIWLEAPTGRVKILDFGLAKAADAGRETESQTHLTASGAIVGTPAYMAPEQASGEPVDGRADLFSLGCVLYELLSGKRAFSGPNTMSILMSLANHTPPSPDTLSSQCPSALSQLVMQLLEKDPANRPASAEGVIQALNELDIATAAPQVSGTALAAGSTPGKSTLPRDSTTPVASAIPLTASTQTEIPRPSERPLTLPATADWPIRTCSVPIQRVALALGGVLLMLVAAVVYRIQTNQGTLVVTIEDPAVLAILEEGGLEIRDKHSDRFWTVKTTEKKPLPSGEYQLIVSQQLLVTDDGGAELRTDTFTLKRKGEVRVRVTLDPDARVAGKDTSKAIPLGGTNAPLSAKFTNTLGMEFALVPKGKAWLGGGDGTPGDKEVEFTQDFYLGVYEVTQEEWEKIMGSNPSGFQGIAGVPKAEQKRFPVENVSWDEIQLFLTRLNDRGPQAGWIYRLPTEAEWEYACRGGPMADSADSAFHFYFEQATNQLLPDQANFKKGLKRTCKVGSFFPNRLGLYDMHGNVWELCDDRLPTDPKDPKQLPRHVWRSGAYHTVAKVCSATSHDTGEESYRYPDSGLRVARVRAATSDPDRRAAEYVLSIGGNVSIKENGQERSIGAVGDLPKGPFELTVVTLSSNQNVSDIGLANFAGCKNLTRLSLHTTPVSDAGLAHFKDCKNLTDVDLSDTNLSDASLERLADYPKLSFVKVVRTNVTKTGVQKLSAAVPGCKIKWQGGVIEGSQQ